MTRRASGQKAKAHGDNFEARLDWQHAQYRARGAAVHRNGPPVVPVMVGKRLLCQAIGEGPNDYTVWDRGWCYVFDAKVTQEAAWPLGKLKEHQARDLDAVTAAGGGRTITGLVVGLSGGARVYWIPWGRLSDDHSLCCRWWRWWRTPRVKAGEGALTAEDCAELGRELDGVDWLPAASVLALGGTPGEGG